MLVLTRRKQEKIIIGDAVVTIIDNKNGKVRLGIDAPQHTNILRGELKPHSEKAAA